MKVVILQMTKRFDNPADERNFYKTQLEIMEKAGFEVEIVLALGKTDEEMIAMLKDADVAYCSGNPPMTRNVIENCPKLKLIQRTGIGFDSVDLDAATEHGVLVQTIAGYCIEELAVHSTALLLCNLRTITWYDRSMRRGDWAKGQGRLPRRVSELTLGILGLGGSGRIMARIWGQGFGCRLIAYDPYISKEAAAASGAELVDFDTFCRESDLISIHAPLNAETHHIFNADAFGKMKPTAIIANIARGGFIDEEALSEALRDGKIAAAGLDTFEKEPMPKNHPLLQMDDRTVLTPHSAYKSKEASVVQKHLPAILPVKALCEHTLYRRYVVNPTVLEKLEGYTVLNEVLC